MKGNFAIIEAGASRLHSDLINGAEVDRSYTGLLPGNALVVNQNQSVIRNNKSVADQLEAHPDFFLRHKISAVLVH
ncbi:hypothetical protein D3C75_788600 [compost metagenome]